MPPSNRADQGQPRSLTRLRQLVWEEGQAVERGDIEALCRIAQLLPKATEAFRVDCRTVSAELDNILHEIRSTHARAESFLAEQMLLTAEELKRCSSGRRAFSAYQGSPVTSTVRLTNVNG